MSRRRAGRGTGDLDRTARPRRLAAGRDRLARLVLAVFAGVALSLIPPATGVRIDTALEHLMIADDPERLRNREVKEAFSNDEILVVAFDLGHPFAAQDLRTLHAFSERVAAIEGVEEVLDLSTVEDVRAAGITGDTLDASPLVDLETVASRIDTIRARVRDHPLYRGTLVSHDGHVLALAIVLELGAPGEAINERVSRRLLALLDEVGPSWPAWVSGYPFSELDASRLLSRDLALLSTIAFLVIAGLVHLLTRSVRMAALTVAVGLWSQLVCAAWFGATETPLTIVTAIVPTVLLAIASTHGLYVAGLLGQVGDDEDAAEAILRLVWRPTLVASASTVVGFLSLRLMPVDVLGQLGTGLAVGVLASTAAALLLVPASLHVFRIRVGDRHRATPGPDHPILAGVRLARRPGTTLVAAGALCLLATTGLSALRIDSDPLSYWSPDSYHRRSAELVRERLSGTLPLNVLIHTEHAGGALDPEVLALAERVVRDLEARPEVDRTLSFLDYLELMDAAITGEPEGRRVLPSQALAAQYMLLYEAGGDPADYRHYIDWDRRSLNLFVRVNDRSASVALGLRERVEALLADAPAGVRVEVLGTWLLFPKAMDAITRGMLEGLALAIAGVFGVMWLSLRSLRLALLALFPSALPIVAFAGLMGWLDLPLSMGTAIVGCVALGLAVDDTAHVLAHLRPGADLTSVYRRVGPALALTTLVLAAGFGVLAASEFQPVVHLGIATATTLVVAFGFNWLVLPSLLRLAGWPLVAGDLTEPECSRPYVTIGARVDHPA